MANLQAIRKRIDSVSSTRQITSTMEMIARTKINRSRKRVDRSEPFAHSMRSLLGTLTDPHAEPVALATPHDDIKNSLIVIIVSDRGLAGSFNHGVFKRADALIKQCRDQEKHVDLIVCGKVGINYYKYRGETPVMGFYDLSARPDVEEAEVIANYLVSQYLENKIDEVFVLYNHLRNAVEQLPVQWRLMPVDMTLFDPHNVDLGSGGISDRDPHLKHLGGLINYEPDRESVLTKLLPEYIAGYLFYMLINSAAGEQVARQAAMRTATDNADDMLSSLNLLYNHLRQEAITTEINEIVGGALGETF